MLKTLFDFEIKILDSLDPIRCEFMDYIMVFFTNLANSGAIWILLAVILFIIPKTRKIGMVVSVALIINLFVVNIIAKPLIARVRPFDIVSTINLVIPAPTDFSFPSGHTAASFAAAVSIIFFSKKWGSASLVLAFIISFSRLYLYVHYPTDVLGGALFGTASAFIAYRLIKMLDKKGSLKKICR